ncbi:MAG: hypothetical protein VB084_16975 [Syntrophomonadaceae bacterium]|nr:hypothetical protein [Syntrophomonadaceae bacterium]
MAAEKENSMPTNAVIISILDSNDNSDTVLFILFKYFIALSLPFSIYGDMLPLIIIHPFGFATGLWSYIP